ncbi:hypothetical protein IWZ01DRAFT_148493 [Phyllosticta capitalensis]
MKSRKGDNQVKQNRATLELETKNGSLPSFLNPIRSHHGRGYAKPSSQIEMSCRNRGQGKNKSQKRSSPECVMRRRPPKMSPSRGQPFMTAAKDAWPSSSRRRCRSRHHGCSLYPRAISCLARGLRVCNPYHRLFCPDPFHLPFQPPAGRLPSPSSFFDDHESAPARKIRPDCPRAGTSARHSQFAASSPTPNPALPAREHKCNDARTWAEERHHAEPKQGATRAMARIEIVVYAVCTLRPQLAWWPESDVRHRDNDGAKGRIQIRTLLLFLRADQASAEDGVLVVDPGNCHVG